MRLSLILLSYVEAESVKFDVFVKCKDHWLRNDQIMYMSRLRSVPEVETVENLWITPTNDYKIGSYLPTNIKFKTKFGNKFKKDEQFRQTTWKKLEFEQICPDEESNQ